jgi:hypothetical protein
MYFARLWFVQQETQRQQKARMLRAQLLSQLRLIEEHLAPRTRPLHNFGAELFEPLHAMWMQADLLEPEEMELVHRTCGILFLLRRKPSLNKKDVNVATDAIQQTLRVLEASANRLNIPSRPGVCHGNWLSMFRGNKPYQP